MKKFLFVLLILILSFAFIGCAEVVYSSYTTLAGGRVMEWSITLDEDEIAKANTDIVDAVIALLQDEANSRIAVGRNAEVIYSEEDPYVVKLREEYESLTEMYIAYGYTGYEENEITESEPINLLYKESINEVSFINQSSIDNLSDRFQSNFSSADFHPENVSLKYVYGTTYDTVYGLNHSDSYTKDDINYYVWDIDVTDADNLSILLAQRIPRVWVWEVFAILGGIMVILVTVILVIIKRRKNNAC